jgi:predicted GIY-YIG superfamily endonuclease
MASSDEPTALYRLFDTDGVLLYVGITRDTEKRWRQHALKKPWWPQVAERTVEWHPTRLAATV